MSALLESTMPVMKGETWAEAKVAPKAEAKVAPKAAAEMQTPIHWFEIPCTDLERAVVFYETLLDMKLTRTTFGDPMAIFPYFNGGTGGTLVQRSSTSGGRKPGPGGTMVYLNCNGRMEEAIASVSKAGGLMLMPKTEVEGGFGFFACLRDTEGNHVGLHSV